MSGAPCMPLWVGDYLSDTQHLTAAEHGAYLMLIMAYWQRGGALPDGPRLAHIARMSAEEWCVSEPVLREFFHVENGQWVHKRIEAEIAKVRAKSEKASAAGKASAQRRSNERSTGVQPPIPKPIPREVNLTPTVEQDAAREGSEGQNQEFDGVWVGEGGRVSIEAQRKAAAIVGVQDAFPLVLIFEGWKESRRARDPDAMFVKAAPKLFANASQEIRAACQPIPKPELEINTAPVAASPQLAALLRRRTHA